MPRDAKGIIVSKKNGFTQPKWGFNMLQSSNIIIEKTDPIEDENE
jgi:hypothetical protein